MLTAGDLALAIDLGTGGCKASLWSAEGVPLAATDVDYPTQHTGPGRREQRPEDWWKATVKAVRRLGDAHPAAFDGVVGVALSGHSLGAVQLDARGRLIAESVPIWSDSRGSTERVFSTVAEEDWYLRTGNGFGAKHYPLFKLETMRAEDPVSWGRTASVVGTKDWVNFCLTGIVATDHSMASGSGAYSLTSGAYDPELLEAAGMSSSLFPEPRQSTETLGGLVPEAARALGLREGTPVMCGAVDNAAMALGSRGTVPGRIYASLGSSSWVTVTSTEPVLDSHARPFVFRHAVPGLYISALSTFSSGTSLAWLCDLVGNGSTVEEFIEMANRSSPGAGGVTFVPTLAGGTPLEGGPDLRGSFTGLELGTTSADLSRAALEGIAFALGRSHDLMRALSGSTDDLLISGGGSRSNTWNQIYADALGTALVRSSVDHHAAALGAAALVFVGTGIWQSLVEVDRAHNELARIEPHGHAGEALKSSRARFNATMSLLANLQTNPNGGVAR